MPVEQRGDGAGVADDAGHVGGSGERPDPEGTIGVFAQSALEVLEVDVAVRVLGDLDHVCDRFTPRQFVGMVLVRADEHHRTTAGRDVGREAVEFVELGGDADSEDRDHPVDRPRGTGAGEDDGVLAVGGAHAGPDDVAGVFAKPGGLQPCPRGLRVGVRIQGEHSLPDVVLDEVERPPGCGVVGIGDPAQPEWRHHRRVGADHRLADPFDQGFRHRRRVQRVVVRDAPRAARRRIRCRAAGHRCRGAAGRTGPAVRS